MTADEIRKRYLKFFESKKHKVVPSDSLIPTNDPTVLFTSAGMNQFKEQFMGVNVAFKRAASCQKCLRTGDLDKVGKTAGHHTFFEMLGNFSFGDYFKKEAVQWAWEFVVDELKLDPKRLWVSVYNDDEEAYDIWKKDVKVPEYKIKKYGADENFWPANAPEKGPDGPCGPCSEIFYDQGEDVGCHTEHCEPSCSCDRFVEVWNLVFTQFNRAGRNKLIPLKSKNIDTGMGLERIAAVMQGVGSNFKTDIFAPLVSNIYELMDKKRHKEDFRVNTIADHIRAVSFMVSDGILPSNEKRGYVERMLIRKAFRFGKGLGIELPFLYKLVPSVAKVMRSQYPELETMRENIADVVLSEERRFQNTLEEGTKVLNGIISGLKENGKSAISGKDAFMLYDTYGFPLELTSEMAQSKGISIDRDGYDKAMKKQKEQTRSKSKIKSSIFVEQGSEDILKKLSESLKPSTFLGYKTFEVEAKVLMIIKSGKRVKRAKKGDRIEVVLDKSTFYGEAGGQVGDSGEILSRTSKTRVSDTKKIGDIIVHYSEVLKGEIREDDKVRAVVDRGDTRLDIARNHTATHLLHYALREVLGRHVKQSGSLVAKDRLRFDFTHFKIVNKRELDRIEELVNELIRKNIEVKTKQLELGQAKKIGAIALFGEKYGKKVRMISVEGYSKELCSGTHLDHTGQIGLFRIISESSIASGMRRIEALTGKMAYRSLKKDEETILDIAAVLKTSKRNIVKAAEDTALKIRNLERGISNLKSGGSGVDIEDIISGSKEISDVRVVSARLKNVDISGLRNAADSIKRKIGSSVIVLGSEVNGKVALVCSVSTDLVNKGVNAGSVIKKISQIVGGSGGGRADFAQAGGKDVARLDEALKEAVKVVQKELEK